MRIIRIGPGSPGLKAKLIIGLVLLMVGAGIAIAAAIAIGMMLFVLPAVVLGSIVYALLPNRAARQQQHRHGAPQILEGQFRIIEHPAPDDRKGE